MLHKTEHYRIILICLLICFLQPLFSQEEKIEEKIMEEEVPFAPRYRHPTYPGGKTELIRFMVNNTKYPPTALKKKRQGKVISVSFIRITGAVGDVMVINETDSLFAAETVKRIRQMPKWIPVGGSYRSTPAIVVIPMYFKSKKKQIIETDYIIDDTMLAMARQLLEKNNVREDLTDRVLENIIKIDPIVIVGYSKRAR